MTGTSTHATVLVVEDDAENAFLLRTMLSQGAGYRVEVATDGVRGLAIARALIPDLVVSDYSMPGLDGMELVRSIKADPALGGVWCVLLTGHASPDLKVKALDAGVDDFLAKPVGMAELLAKVRAALRTKALHDALRVEKAELAKLQQKTQTSFEQLLDVLLALVDLHAPGALERAADAARVAARLGEALAVPPSQLSQLVLAARFHEVGALVDPHARTPGPARLHARRHGARLSAAVLERVAGLRGAASVLSAVEERWDGTGEPDRMRGDEIPLPSRVLRVACDFLELAAQGGTDDAVRTIVSHAGTAYDPFVVAHLDAVVRRRSVAPGAPLGQRVPVGELEEGMLLVQDLVTPAGLKLVAGGTRLTRAVIDAIRRRHESEPFLRGALVARG